MSEQNNNCIAFQTLVTMVLYVNGMTDAELSEALNVPTKTVYYWKTGKYAPAPMVCSTLCTKLLNLVVLNQLIGPSSGTCQSADPSLDRDGNV